MRPNNAAAPLGNLATILQSGICRTKFRHRPAPSLFYFPGLYSAPLWESSIPILANIEKVLADNFDAIKREYAHLRSLKVPSDFDTSRDEHTLHSGKWEWNSYVLKGKRQSEFGVHCPTTAEVLESIQYPKLMTQTPFSFAFFSTLSPQAKINAHYGPCNLRLRCHFPLSVPSSGDCGMRVGDQVVRWEVGKALFFDDCYEHEVWNNTSEERVVLLFDVWHPDLHNDEILAIQDMFAFAEQQSKQGWNSKKTAP